MLVKALAQGASCARLATLRPPLPSVAASSRGLADRVAQGFSSPGNSAISEEMKEAGRPEEVRRNEEATQRHLYSEKGRFDQGRFDNPERTDSPFGSAFAEGGDTGPDRAVSEATGRTAPGQSLGINIIPEKLAAAKLDEGVPEAPMGTAGAKPGEVTPDNRAGGMGPKPGNLAPRAGLGAQEGQQGEREALGTLTSTGASTITGGNDGASAGAEGESEDIIEELHKGDEWAS